MKRTIKPKSSFTRKMAEGGLVMTTNSPTPPPDQQLQEARRERQRRRMTAEMDDLRSKLEREKAEALCQQKEAMNRAFRVQLAKLMKEKEDLIRKCQTKNQLAPSSPTNSAATNNTNPAELQKLVYELGVVRSEKKKTEDQLQVLKESEQVRFENMRSLLDDKTRELTQLQKQLKQQIARLREEAHTKDRVISHLESELRIQSGRAQQFRDILEQNLLSCCNKTGHHTTNQQQQNAQDVTSSLVTTSTNRERQLQIQVDDLQLAIKEQQETFAQEKRELLRRISETEQEQKPLKKKSKEYLIRNVLLSTRNHLLVGKVKMMQQQSRDDGDVVHKRSRQNVNHLAAPPKNDKQRRMEYVQQIQKLRKEQRYYSMWELPPLLEVETDSAGESGGSEGSLSPAATSGVCSSSESAWSDETRRELEVLFSQLSREHSDLQRNYQMLHEKLRQLTSFSDTDAANVNYATLQADYTAAKARIRDLEEILQLKNSKPSSATPSLLEIQAKFVREKHSMQTQLAMLNHRLIEAKNKTQAVQAELNETRDQNELLEFRILELEESQEKATHQCCPVEEMKDHTVNCKDVCTDTDSGDDVSAADSGITSLTSYSLIVDCPSSTSSSTSGGLSPDADYLGEKISAVKTELQLMVPCVSEAKHKTVLAQVQALLGVCQSRLLANKNNSSPTVESSQSNWDCWQQLQESGIFEEDHQRSSRNSSSFVDSTTQTDEERRHREMTHQSVQVEIEVKDSSVQSDSRCQEDKTVQVSSTLELAEAIEGWCQTEEPIMTLTDFRDIELYYVEQIELLQKEKASHRKKFQVCRDETTQVVQQLELLTRQFHEREKQFDDILQKNCEAFERELESARMEGGGNNEELSALKECLQSIWQEMKNYVDIVHPTGAATAGVEFGQALVSSLNGLCTELGQLRTRVVDLAEMEQAFQTTLQQADGLVHHIEEKHLNRIRELELNEQELKQQLDLASRNRSSVYQSEEEDDDGSLQFKLQELKSENEALTAQAAKVEELQEYCQQLHGRLEEYDQREKSFQLVIQEAERRFSSKEQRYKEEVESLRIELDKCRESELAWPKKLELRENQLSTIKNELETERVAIARLETEVKDLQSKSTKDDTSFRNEVTKLRSQLKASIAQLSELESLNCALRDQIMEHQHRITSLQRSLEMESCRNQDLMAENNQLIQAQNELINRHNPTSTIVMVGKPLTEELFEVETDDAVTVIATGVAHPNNTSTTLDDFREISLPTTPTVIEGCTDIFEEHFKVLESLESYLESQQLIGAVSEDESGISTSPSIHENEPMAMLEAQLSQLRTEKHFLLNSVVQSQKKDEIIHILIDQLKYNAPRQYLVDTAAQIRRMTAEDSELQHPFHHRDKDIEDVCRLLEEPVDLSESYNAPVSSGLLSMSSSMSSSCHSNNDRSTPTPSAIRQLVRQTTVTVLPEEDPLLSPASDLRVTRKVGQDGLVIAWHPSPDPECTGYLICINGQEAQRVRNATRTKAVLCGLDLHSEMEISIYSLSTKGLVSSPDCALYLPEENVADSSTTPEPRTTENRVALPSDGITPREVVVQTFYTNSSVTVRSSRRVNGAPNPGSRIPVRASMP